MTKTYAEFHGIDLHDLKQTIVAIKSLTMFYKESKKNKDGKVASEHILKLIEMFHFVSLSKKDKCTCT